MKAGLLYDGSEQSKKAFKKAIEILSPHTKATLAVLQVVELPETDPPYGYLPDEAAEIIKRRTEFAEKQLKELEPALIEAHLKYSLTIERGDPRSLLNGFVEKNGIELVFLGSRGLSGAVGFLVGSTSQYAMHNCPCSVLIVK